MNNDERIALLGNRIIWTDGAGQECPGSATAYGSDPAYLIDLDDGRRLMVPVHMVRKEAV